MKNIYHTLEDGKVVEICNWPGLTDDDAIIARYLGQEEINLYLSAKKKGASDQEIFTQLNPYRNRHKRGRTYQVPVETLTKDQVIWLINQKLKGKPLTNLSKLTRNELIEIFLNI